MAQITAFAIQLWRNERMMRVIFVRHGEAGNKDSDRVGDNQPLTPRGIEQVRAAAGWMLGRVAVEQVRSSWYRRCQETSEIIAEALGIDGIIFDDRLNEVSKGDWQGRPAEEVMALEAEIDPADRPTFRPPGGESWFDAGRRVVELVKERRSQGSSEELSVSHSHPIRMGVGILTAAPLHTWEGSDSAPASITMLYSSQQNIWLPEPSVFNFTSYH